MIGRASILARLAGFSDCLIISPTCSVVPSSNSINVAEIGTEVVSLDRILLTQTKRYQQPQLPFEMLLGKCNRVKY